ncbi:MAG: GNAT family N-acetyltransferase [Lachnospiraceae bacterium]|nr:GNAT family N-acetyltransferase [Lachnospiraceae bacterium]
MLTIRKATIEEHKEVVDFYYTLIDQMNDADYRAEWKKGVYPSEEYLKDAIEKNELFIGKEEDKIVAGMIVNHNCHENYKQVKWAVDAKEDEVMVLHTLGVLPSCSGRGYARQMVEHALFYAKEKGQKAMRLDMLDGTLRGAKVYTGVGFLYKETIQMYYADTGWANFRMYEYIL